MKTNRILMMLMALFFVVSVQAQSKIFENVLDVELKRSLAITNNQQIVGYVYFYKIDKMKKSSMYRLSILDENLKEIGFNEFEGGKDLFLKRAVYESEQILLSFVDEDKFEGVEKFVKVFDLKGKITGTIPYDPDKVKKGMFGAAAAAVTENMYDGTDNVEGKGFVVVNQSKAKTGGIDVQMIGLNGKLKWEKNITAEKGDRTELYLLSTTPNTLLFFQLERGGVANANATVFLVGMNVDNGKEIFKKPMDIKGFSYEPMMVKKTTDGKLKIVSSIYNEEAKFLKARPIGISISDLNDLTGELKVVKDFTFANDLSSVLTMKNDTKSEAGYIKPHNVLMMADGSMVLVGEFFRKTVSAVGTAVRLMSRGGGGNVSAAQATIDDMFLLRINNNLKAVALETVEKDKERINMPDESISIGLMARLLTYYGDFGYMYTDEGMDGSNKTIVARGSFGDEKYGTVAINVDPVKGFTQKRFNINKEKNVSYYISRGKPGYVVVSKYNSKAKTLSVNLEKVN